MDKSLIEKTVEDKSQPQDKEVRVGIDRDEHSRIRGLFFDHDGPTLDIYHSPHKAPCLLGSVTIRGCGFDRRGQIVFINTDESNDKTTEYFQITGSIKEGHRLFDKLKRKIEKIISADPHLEQQLQSSAES